MILNLDIKSDHIDIQYLQNLFQEEDSITLKRSRNKLSDFWGKNLKDCSPELKFPYDYSRKNIPSGFGGREQIIIPAKCAIRLKELSKEEDTTLFVTLLSITGAIFGKYSGENDICIGIPFSCRSNSWLDNIIGMFVNTIVIRLKVEEHYNFRQFIKYAKNVFLKAIAHHDLPFDKIVEIVQPERISNMNPLFQVSLVWMNNMTMPLDLTGIKSERIILNEGVSPFDITIYLWEEGNYIKGEIEYNKDLLKCKTIIRFKENFLKFIENLIEKPDASLSSIPLIADSEVNQLLAFTASQTSCHCNRTIIELFEEQVDLNPDKIAAVFKDKTLTYKQLNCNANHIARYLRNMGINSNMPIGILVEKSLEMITGILGILKAGGAYVPIDPEYPKQRINFILNDSGCRILLTQEQFMNIEVERVTKINLNSTSIYATDSTNVKIINRSSDTAYIMYTSGTTGVPKGVMIGHKGVIRLVRDTNYIDLTSEDRILLTGAIVFDATTFEIWGALLNGCTLYIVEKETILSAGSLGKELMDNKITILWLTSTLFTYIAETRTDIFNGLKYLLVGGDVLSAPHINKVRKANPGLKVINGYGPTENTTFSTTFQVDKDYDYNIPIGKPISNSTAYIFDSNLNLQPIGVIGELYVGGDGISMGYINRDDLNKKTFVDNPYNPGEKLYKTGDYAKWLPDGNIEFHGRIDNQLKIRGFRVELEEIESVISETEGVIETVIKPVKIEEGEYYLLAFLNVSEAFSMETKEISRQVREKLPSYMIPSAYKLMHGFPKTVNGKTDRKALVIKKSELESKSIIEKSDLTLTERVIHKIWCEALKIDDISKEDNFFNIGGNSLLAISVFSKIEATFKVSLALRVFFDSPKIKDLAESVDIAIQKSVENRPQNNNDYKNFETIKGEI
jgi:amino acid adenylation domain-containing protein